MARRKKQNTSPAKKVGALLKQKRQEKGLKLEDIVEGTRIRLLYIKAIEAGKLEELPATFYTRAYIKSYSEFLEEDSKEILSKLSDEVIEQDNEEDEGGSVSAESSPSYKPNWWIFFLVIVGLFALYVLQEVSESHRQKQDAVTEAEETVQFYSDADVEITAVSLLDFNLVITDEEGNKLVDQEMRYGDTWFASELLNNGKKVYISEDIMENLEFYVDGELVSFASGVEYDEEGNVAISTNDLLSRVQLKDVEAEAENKKAEDASDNSKDEKDKSSK